VSKLAAERATDPRVRAYAQGLVQRQTQFTNELIALMSAKGVSPPQGLPADKATKLHRLASLPRSAAFDEGYVRVVGIEDHQANIAMLEQGRRIATDRDLLAWIDRNLPVLRRLLSVGQALAGSLSG
jgi:putative membrane protein